MHGVKEQRGDREAAARCQSPTRSFSTKVRGLASARYNKIMQQDRPFVSWAGAHRLQPLARWPQAQPHYCHHLQPLPTTASPSPPLSCHSAPTHGCCCARCVFVRPLSRCPPPPPDPIARFPCLQSPAALHRTQSQSNVSSFNLDTPEEARAAADVQRLSDSQGLSQAHACRLSPAVRTRPTDCSAS